MLYRDAVLKQIEEYIDRNSVVGIRGKDIMQKIEAYLETNSCYGDKIKVVIKICKEG